MSDESRHDEKKHAFSLPRAAVGIVHMILLAAALRDLRQRPAEEVNGNKRMWYGLVFIRLVGPLAYFAIGRKREPQMEIAADAISTSRLVEA